MPPREFSSSRLIPARPEVLYEILADYRSGHPRILPEPPFRSLVVERGGRGAGTLIRVEMKLLGRTRSFRAAISEPEPGRVLVEDNDTGYRTTFSVEPREGGAGALVTISTALPAGGGLRGFFERRVVPRLLRPVYIRELELLEQVAGESRTGSSEQS
jgi:hypothetical protein